MLLVVKIIRVDLNSTLYFPASQNALSLQSPTTQNLSVHTQQQALTDKWDCKTEDKYADVWKVQYKHNLLSVRPSKGPQEAARTWTEVFEGTKQTAAATANCNDLKMKNIVFKTQNK